MKKYNKTAILLSIFLLFTALLLPACKKEEKVTYPSIFYEVSGGKVALYDTVSLVLVDENALDVQWFSTDEEIISVSNGLLKAYKTGSATIKAVCGKKTQTQTIKVYESETALEIDVTDISLVIGQSYTPNLNLLFDGKKVDGAEFSFESSQDTVSVQNKKLFAESQGIAQISVTAYIDGKIVANASFSCTVNEDQGIYPDKAIYKLYVSDNVRGQAFDKQTKISAVVYSNGEIIENAQVTFSVEDSSIATVENNVITAVSVGTTYIVGEYVSGETTLKTVKIPVIVSVPILSTNDFVIIDNRNEFQQLDAEKILNKQSIGKIKNLTTYAEHIITENKFKTTLLKSGEYDCVIYDEQQTVGVQVTLIVADYVIYDKEDLNGVSALSSGYVALSCNLQDVEYSTMQGHVFSGVFNGFGHRIENINFVSANGGLFSQVSGATLKNVAIVNSLITGVASGTLFYRIGSGEAVIDNVYISATLGSGNYNSGAMFAFGFNGKVSIKNSILETNGFSNSNGMVLGRSYACQTIFESCYVIGDGELCGTSNSDYNRYYTNINKIVGVKYASKTDFIVAKQKGKLNFSKFNHYWNMESEIPVI